MQRNDQTPTYNLKVVVRETGLKHDTLRAWERRYGLPQPQRSDGGHRLYSQHDIDTLKWLVARQKEGLSISRAVDLWHQLEAEGQDPLLSMVQTTNTVPVVPVGGAWVGGQSLADLQEQWVQACLNFQEVQAEQLFTQATALYSPELVCLEFLQKGLHTIGQMWANGKATAQQEHFASALATRRLDAMLAAAPLPTRAGRILVGCPPEESHAFSLLLASYLLRRSGWDTVFLGANVPLNHLQDTVTAIKPNLVILAAQQFFTAASLLEVTLALQKEQMVVAFGGLIFNLIPQLRQCIPGYFLGDTVEQLPKTLETFITKPVVPAAVAPVTDGYAKVKNYFSSQQSLIETRLLGQMGNEIPLPILINWNLNTGRNLLAALTFGDLELLSNTALWDQSWWINTPLSQEALHSYLAAYIQTAQAVLDEQGQLLLAGLAHIPV